MPTVQGLYAITPTFAQVSSDRWLVNQSRALLAGGVACLQLRDKSQVHSRRLRVASALAELCRDFGARFIVNDDPELALASGAHGVHLGQGDGELAVARRLLGDRAIIGRTCHDSLALAQAAAAEGADYLAFGRFFASHTKPDAPPAPLSLLPAARRATALPLVAIGGVNRDNAPSLVAAGAQAIALCQALYGAADPQAEARGFNQLFNSMHQEQP